MIEPGWYPDPLGGQGARYWNGAQWDGAIQPEPSAGPEEFPKTSPTTEGPRRRRPWPLWLGLGAATTIAIVSTTFALTRPTLDTSPTLDTPVAAPTTTVASPTISPAEIAAAAVEISMQQKLDNDPDLKDLGLTVVEVVLVNKSGNEFKGIATVKTSDGVEHDVPVDVTADSDNTVWETPPGAFIFAQPPPPTAPPRRPPSPAPIPAPAPSPVEDFKICPSGLSGVASDDTSCAFADSVRLSWYDNPGSLITAYCPVTHQSYVMRCAPATTTVWVSAMRCEGTNAYGVILIVYIA